MANCIGHEIKVVWSFYFDEKFLEGSNVMGGLFLCQKLGVKMVCE